MSQVPNIQPVHQHMLCNISTHTHFLEWTIENIWLLYIRCILGSATDQKYFIVAIFWAVVMNHKNTKETQIIIP